MHHKQYICAETVPKMHSPYPIDHEMTGFLVSCHSLSLSFMYPTMSCKLLSQPALLFSLLQLKCTATDINVLKSSRMVVHASEMSSFSCKVCYLLSDVDIITLKGFYLYNLSDLLERSLAILSVLYILYV